MPHFLASEITALTGELNKTLFEIPVWMQMARRAQSGFPLLRPVWRAALWSLTEFPAVLESALPRAPAIPLAPGDVLSTKSPAYMPTTLRPLSAQLIDVNATMCPFVTRVLSNRFKSRIHALTAALHRSVEL